MTKGRAVLLGLLLGLWGLPDSHAYVRMTDQRTGLPLFWSPPMVTLTLSVPAAPCASISGDDCYKAAAAIAADDWNNAGAQFTFVTRNALADPCRYRDGLNTVNFGLTFCGLPFPPGTLAIANTASLPTGQVVEADVIFNLEPNRGFFWDVYEGPQRDVAGTPIYDFYRVVSHEFGHVLGLDHPDKYGQVVRALMNSRASDIDRPQPDDIRGIHAIYGSRTPLAPSRGALENPRPGSAKSGVGVISGWVCEADTVVVDIDAGRFRFPVVYGTGRGDTQAVCGDTHNGFVTLVNWNLVGAGSLRIRVLADGVEIATTSFTVATFGQEWLQGASGTYDLPNFPQAGDTTVIEWEESSQNFVIRTVR